MNKKHQNVWRFKELYLSLHRTKGVTPKVGHQKWDKLNKKTMAKKAAYKPRNPFIYDGYEGPEYFCDRIEETEKVINTHKISMSLFRL